MARYRPLFALLLLGLLAACNTVEGVSRDVGGTARFIKNRL